MAYSYIEHTADIGIRAEGATLEEAFCSGAEALLNIIFELETINAKETVSVECEAWAPELLFVEFLNELIGVLDIKGLALKEVTKVKITQASGGLTLKATAGGEPFDLERHAVKTEAKAATYAGLSYELEGDKHTLKCIVDI